MKQVKYKKRGKTMLIIILSTLGVIGLMTWAIIAYMGRSQSLSVTAIEHSEGDLYLIHLTKPDALDWQAGAYAQFNLPSMHGASQTTPEAVSGATERRQQGNQKSLWLTIASNPDDNEILLLTHNSGSHFKQALTALSVGSQLEMNWLGSSLRVDEGNDPLICFASDVGVAAIRPIVRRWAGQRPVVFSHLDKGVNVFHEELQSLARESQNLTYETSSSLSQSQSDLDDAIAQYGNHATYLLAGVPDDLQSMKQYMEGKGIQSGNIHMERFRGLR